MFKYRNKALGWTAIVLSVLIAFTIFPLIMKSFNEGRYDVLMLVGLVNLVAPAIFVVGRELTGAYDEA